MVTYLGFGLLKMKFNFDSASLDISEFELLVSKLSSSAKVLLSVDEVSSNSTRDAFDERVS